MKTDIKNTLIVTAIILLIGLGAGILIGYGIWHPKDTNTGITEYFTKVVEVPKYITKPVPYEKVIPPHIEYRYMSYGDSMKLVSVRDSLICLVSDGPTHDTVMVKSRFLTAFPTQPKLINMDLQMDSVWLTLLDINANLFTKQYPLDLTNYKYRFEESNLSYKKLPRPWNTPKVSKWSFSLDACLGLNVINYPTVLPEVYLPFTVTFTRAFLQIEPSMTITNQPEFSIYAKAGYRLWKWPR